MQIKYHLKPQIGYFKAHYKRKWHVRFPVRKYKQIKCLMLRTEI
jgi:hypothetical protein